MSEYIVQDTSLTAVADAIREKSGSNESLVFPNGFVDEIENISVGINIDDIATNTHPSGAITLGSGINAIAVDAFTRKPITSIVFNGSSIGDRAFQGCTQLKTVTAANCLSIGANSFNGASTLETVSIPNCTNIDTYAFYGCNSLKNITLTTNALTIGTFAFQNCSLLQNCDFSNVEVIQNSAFRNANALGCTFNPTTVNDSGFRDVFNFNVNFFPRLTTINGTYSFAGSFASDKMCTFTTIVFPVLSTISSSYSLSYEPGIIVIDIGNLTTIQPNTFVSNRKMNTLILRKSSVTTLSNINAFNDTPFASNKSGSTLYVPSSLISDYQSATNWSTILGYDNNQIKAIEGSIYETQYADGTPISTT